MLEESRVISGTITRVQDGSTLPLQLATNWKLGSPISRDLRILGFSSLACWISFLFDFFPVDPVGLLLPPLYRATHRAVSPV